MAANHTSTPANLTVGTASWTPSPEGEKTIDEVVTYMKKSGITRLDTARRYGGGASETVIGNKGLANRFSVTTKSPIGTGPGLGAPEKIISACKESLETLGVQKVDKYLFHGPDDEAAVEDTMGAIQILFLEGRFIQFGLSNFTPEDVVKHYDYAKSKGFVLPTVYQSSYSLATRLNETRLFPILRKLGISIQAYSPMAGGLLAKTREQIEEGKGRWDPTSLPGSINRFMYYKQSYFDLLEAFGKLSEESGISRAGLAYRWMRYHSILDGSLGDEMILGATNAAQAQEAFDEVLKGPLEDWIVQRIEECWEMVKADAPVDSTEAFRHVVANMAK